jgi:hypothetical protein
MPPLGYQTPWASSEYGIRENVAGASKGLNPIYTSWKVNAAFKRGESKKRDMWR